MMSDSEEEEHLVYLEFDGLLDSELFKKEPFIFKLVGADGDKPVLQIGHQVFLGEYRDIAGTALFFEEDTSTPQHDPVFSKVPDKQLRYMCKTRKSLLMSRVFVKNPSSQDKVGDEVQESPMREHSGEVEGGLSEPTAGPSWAPDVDTENLTSKMASNCSVAVQETVQMVDKQLDTTRNNSLTSKLNSEDLSRMKKVELRLSIPAFEWIKSIKPFKKNYPQYTRQGVELPVIDSPRLLRE
uniref:(California timema) hypothetical protein n=1 Tax=Timema californicum TaxID=61474 RepID=A0A7R9J599_TIMCA|nr:unnamed protein product [Timema californicum]